MTELTFQPQRLPFLREARLIVRNAAEVGISIDLVHAHAVYVDHQATRHWPFAFEPRFLAVYLPQVCDEAIPF